MDSAELHSITHAEIHGLLRATERDISDALDRLTRLLADKNYARALEAAGQVVEFIGARSAYAMALAVVSGMDALLDDKTTRGVEA